jgi:hypothetical protein
MPDSIIGAKRLVSISPEFRIEFFSEGNAYFFVGEENMRVKVRYVFYSDFFEIQYTDIEQGSADSVSLLLRYKDSKEENVVQFYVSQDNRFGWKELYGIKKPFLCRIEDMDADSFLPIRYNYDIWQSENGELTILDQCARKNADETSYATVNGERVLISFKWNDDKTFIAYSIDGDGAITQNVILSGTYSNTFMHTTLQISEDNLFGGIKTLNLNAERYESAK